MYYAVFLFEQAGIGSNRGSLLANGIQGAVLNVFTWPNMYWMDTWGRRTPMVIGGAGMGISMMLIGTIMKTKGQSLESRILISILILHRKSGLQPYHKEDKF